MLWRVVNSKCVVFVGIQFERFLQRWKNLQKTVVPRSTSFYCNGLSLKQVCNVKKTVGLSAEILVPNLGSDRWSTGKLLLGSKTVSLHSGGVSLPPCQDHFIWFLTERFYLEAVQ